MPRIRLALFPKGLHLNNDHTQQPEGSLRKARNAASLAGQGTLRSAPPNRTLAGAGPSRARSITTFNGRFITHGETGAAPRFERENAAGGGVYTVLNHTTLTAPTVNLRTGVTTPALFATAPPTPDKDEYLFALDSGNQSGDNAALKLSNAGVLSHWGILPPSPTDVSGITGAVLTQDEKFINTAAADPLENSADWTLATGDESALSADTAISTSANPAVDGNSIKFIVGKDDVAQITRAFGGNIDLTTFGAKASSDEDFVQLWVRVRRPKHIQSLEVAFDTTAAGDFKKDFFSREVTFRLVKRKQRKKLIGMGDLVPVNKVQDFLKNQSKTNDLTFAEEQGNQKVPVAKNTWSRITLPKNTFDQSGSPSWATVRAIRFTLHANKEGKTAVFLDRLTINGGAGMHGDYEYTITYSSEDGTPASAGSRSNPAIDDDKGTSSGLRNSLITVKVPNVERQGVRLTFPALAFDPQTTRLEIWRTLGNGKAFFRCGYITVTGGALGGGTTFDDTAADYYGMNSTSSQVVAGNNTSFAVLDPTVELPLDNTSPNDPSFAFQTMADRPHLGRMWWGRGFASATETGATQASIGNQGLVYYSPPGRMESVQGTVFITSGVSDPVQSMVVWNDRLFVFTKSGLYEIVGTNEPFVAQKIEAAPGTLLPYTVTPSAIGILWVAEDGIYKFNGQYAENITDPMLMPVYRHRLATEELAISRLTAGRGVAGKNAYYLGPDAGTTFTMVYDFEPGTWRYLDAIGVTGINSGALMYDPLTGQILGDSTGGGPDVTEFDTQTYPTSSTVAFLTIRVFLWRSGPGRQGILRKVWIDATRMTNGASTSIAPTTVIDHVSTALATFNPAATNDDSRTIQEYNLNFPGELFELDLIVNNCRNVRINAIEADIYAPEQTDAAT